MGGILAGKNFTDLVGIVRGKPSWNEGPPALNTSRSLQFKFGSDSAITPNGYQVPDILSTYAAATRTTLIPASSCPKGMRPYLTKLQLSVDGSFDWVGATSITVEDTQGDLLAYFPLNSLRHGASYLFPNCGQNFPLLVGPGANCITTTSYNAVTGVLTIGSAILGANLLVGTPVMVVDYAGTNASPVGQMCMVSANGTSTITLLRNDGSGLPPTISLDGSNATVAIPYWAMSAGGTAGFTISLTGTPLTANQLDNGYDIVVVKGAGLGGVRGIQTNTNAGVIVLANALNNTTGGTSLVQITTQPELNGALDGCVAQQWAAAQPNTGLQVVVNGSPSAGSPIRVYGEGYWADQLAS